MEGTSAPEPCKIVDELTVTSLDKKTSISLPPSYIYKTLPDAIHEIPAPADVTEISGLEDLAPNFYKKNDEWPTIILIGRDCIQAQTQEQTRFATDGTPMATKTPFGWVLIGEKRNQLNNNKVQPLAENKNLKTAHSPVIVTLPTSSEWEINDATAENSVYEMNKEVEQQETNHSWE